MMIKGMAHFQNVCKKKLVEWYKANKPETHISVDDVLSFGHARPYRIISVLWLRVLRAMEFMRNIPITETDRSCMKMYMISLQILVSYMSKEVNEYDRKRISETCNQNLQHSL